MTNHAFVITKGNTTHKKVGLATQDILESRFNDDFYLISCEEFHSIYTKGYDYELLNVWNKTKRTIEMRKGYGFISNWLQSVIQNDLAIKFKGKQKDEGVEDTWLPKPNIYPTFRSWWETRYDISEHKNFRNEHYNRIVINFPKHLQKYC